MNLERWCDEKVAKDLKAEFSWERLWMIVRVLVEASQDVVYDNLETWR
jgi:hypothetical protein